VATTGARCADDVAYNGPVWLRPREELRLGTPVAGLRTYVAVRGGLDVAAVLGSRSTDVLAGIGPPVVQPGTALPIGRAARSAPIVDLAPLPEPAPGEVQVRVIPGPRNDWFVPEAWPTLTGKSYEVGPECNRVGIRLRGEALPRSRTGELPSEGMTRGAIQVPASGQPVVFLADHPVTGGYPVIGYVVDEDVDLCAQVVPGQRLRFRPYRST
jgi:biotin-dependent carboxylase-like uncharacterized protein